MGMQYAPQNAINQFTSQMGITGLNNMAASNRLSMELASREGMERNRLKEQMRSTNLNYSIADRNASVAEGTLGMQLEGQKFNQYKDVATFNENKRAKGFQEELDLLKFAEPGVIRAENRADEDASADSNWEVWNQGAGVVRGLLNDKIGAIDVLGAKDAKTQAERIAERDALRARLKAYDSHISWAGQQYKTRGRSFLRPFFGSRFGNLDSLYDIAGLQAPPPAAPAAKPPGRKDW